MAKIFVVFGTTGEYSDRTEWLVDARHTNEAAKARVFFLEDKMRALGAVGSEYFKMRGDAALEAMKEFDPHFSMDYTGTSYYYSSVELKEA